MRTRAGLCSWDSGSINLTHGHRSSRVNSAGWHSHGLNSASCFPTLLLLLLLLPSLSLSISLPLLAAGLIQEPNGKPAPLEVGVNSTWANCYPQEHLIDFFFPTFATGWLHVAQLHHQPAATLPKLARASPVCCPRPWSGEQCAGGSA